MSMQRRRHIGSPRAWSNFIR